MRQVLMGAALVFAATPALAQTDHAQHGQTQHPAGHAAAPDASQDMLAASNPRDGAVLAQSPRTLTLAFMHPVLLQTVAIADANGAPVRANFRRPAAPTAAYTIALPALASGAYTAQWTASGMGHAMHGAVRFTVQ